MPYNLTNSDGSTLVTLADQTIDSTTTSLSLIGKGALPGYGQAVTENFLYLLENFASSTAPFHPQKGQQWFNTILSQMQHYDGAQWLATGGFAYGSTSSATNNGVTIGGAISSSNRKSGYTGVVIIIGNTSTTIGVEVAEGTIIAVTCTETILPQLLPAEVSIDGVNYALATRFINGFVPGINMATIEGYNFNGTSSSVHADVAERYESDQPLEPGTVVTLGGAKEIQKSNVNSEPFGVVSTKPGVCLNSNAGDDSTHPFVALVGRVPCKVLGKVKKFDYLVCSEAQGVAMAHYDQKKRPQNCIGQALQSKDDMKVSLIEITIK